jgi:hypothetical protein
MKDISYIINHLGKDRKKYFKQFRHQSFSPATGHSGIQTRHLISSAKFYKIEGDIKDR